MTNMIDIRIASKAARHSLPDIQCVQLSIFQELRHREELRAGHVVQSAAPPPRERLLSGLFHSFAFATSGPSPTLH